MWWGRACDLKMGGWLHCHQLNVPTLKRSRRPVVVVTLPPQMPAFSPSLYRQISVLKPCRAALVCGLLPQMHVGFRGVSPSCTFVFLYHRRPYHCNMLSCRLIVVLCHCSLVINFVNLDSCLAHRARLASEATRPSVSGRIVASSSENRRTASVKHATTWSAGIRAARAGEKHRPLSRVCSVAKVLRHVAISARTV
jgi:hypothetical protein